MVFGLLCFLELLIFHFRADTVIAAGTKLLKVQTGKRTVNETPAPFPVKNFVVSPIKQIQTLMSK